MIGYYAWKKGECEFKTVCLTFPAGQELQDKLKDIVLNYMGEEDDPIGGKP
jgi:hypothetical protein